MHLNPTHKLFALFCLTIPREITAYNILIQEIIAFAIYTISFVLMFTKILLLFLHCCPIVMSVWTLYMQKLVATKSATNLEQSSSHTCLTSSEQNCAEIETFWLFKKNITHSHTRNSFKQTAVNRFRHLCNPSSKRTAPEQQGEVQSDAQILELLAESSACLPPHPIQWGFRMMLSSPSC